MAGRSPNDRGIIFSPQMDAYDFVWENTIAKDFFFATPYDEMGREAMMTAARGGGSMGHFVPKGAGRENLDLRTKEGRSSSRTHMPRWRYGEDGRPERYMEKLPKREIFPEAKTGFMGANLSSPFWNMHYGTYRRGLDESPSLIEGVEGVLHHEGMHEAMDQILSDIYSERIADRIQEAGIPLDFDERKEALQADPALMAAFKEIRQDETDQLMQAHEFGAHIGEVEPMQNPNTIIGRKEGRGAIMPKRHDNRLGKYLGHTSTRLRPEGLAAADESVRASATGIPFPTNIKDVSDFVHIKPDSRNKRSHNIGLTDEGWDLNERLWEEHGDYGEHDYRGKTPEEDQFIAYNLTSPDLGDGTKENPRESFEGLPHQLIPMGETAEWFEHTPVSRLMQELGQVPQMRENPDHGGMEIDVPRVRGLRALANAAKLGGSKEEMP